MYYDGIGHVQSISGPNVESRTGLLSWTWCGGQRERRWGRRRHDEQPGKQNERSGQTWWYRMKVMNRRSLSLKLTWVLQTLANRPRVRPAIQPPDDITFGQGQDTRSFISSNLIRSTTIPGPAGIYCANEQKTLSTTTTNHPHQSFQHLRCSTLRMQLRTVQAEAAFPVDSPLPRCSLELSPSAAPG